MELIDQHTKAIMEGCKERAKAAGLRFEDESLEYIVTNRDLLELSPKLMIPTLYDYWVHDVEVLKEKGKYELYPGNPYETVINTRPAISFYNDNNPDWLNVMIFYHVLAHIDFFQNNIYFRHTWDYDFAGQALSDKRLIARYRSEKGRWVDYIVEFSRSIDNLASYHTELARKDRPHKPPRLRLLDYYFDTFLQKEKNVSITKYIKEIERYNACVNEFGQSAGEETFFARVKQQHPEFETLYNKSQEGKEPEEDDLMQFLMSHSDFLNKSENLWMKAVVQVVRNTSLFFQPQIRTKIMNEGWASYWHDVLFRQDDRISGHEVDFARVHAVVTSLPRVGLNPYALGMRMFEHIEEMADKGHYSYEFQRLQDARSRQRYDAHTAQGQPFIFYLRENYCDFMFINSFLDQDFMDRYQLFVAGERLDQNRMVRQYYIKSRKAADYRQMMLEMLYHPPHITISKKQSNNGKLYLVHLFEEKPLVKEYITNTMLGIEYLWGAPVQLETSEVVSVTPPSKDPRSAQTAAPSRETPEKPEIKWQRVLYTMENRKLARQVL